MKLLTEKNNMLKNFSDLSRKVFLAGKIELNAITDVMRYGLPDYIIQYFGGIGDNLLCSTVTREIKKRNPNSRIWIITEFPELFFYNDDINHTFRQEHHWHLWYSPMLRSRRLDIVYTRAKYAGENSKDDVSPSEHILAIMCRKAGIRGEVNLRPYFYLTEEEKLKGRYADRQLAIQCISPDSTPAMLNKLWYVDRFQIVVDRIKAEIDGNIEIIQIGNDKDPPLNGVKDLRGKTSIRSIAAILSQSECFVGTVGLLMHLGRSVECRSVIIYGGREHSSQSGYPCNENLDSYVECAPCWKWNDCNHNKKCMDSITPEEVLRAIGKVLTKNGIVLGLERAAI